MTCIWPIMGFPQICHTVVCHREQVRDVILGCLTLLNPDAVDIPDVDDLQETLLQSLISSLITSSPSICKNIHVIIKYPEFKFFLFFIPTWKIIDFILRGKRFTVCTEIVIILGTVRFTIRGGRLRYKRYDVHFFLEKK